MTDDDASTNGSTVDVARLPGLIVAGLASIGAGAVHAVAAGLHAEHTGLTRVFITLAVAQLAGGLLALLRPHRAVSLALVLIGAGAVAGWLTTRLTGLTAIAGLDVAEAPQFADTTAALLGAVSAGGAAAALLAGWLPARPPRLALPTIAMALLVVPAMVSAASHVHDHDAGVAHADDGSDGHDHGTASGPIGELAAADALAGDEHGDEHASPTIVDADGEVVWPRPWDPAGPLDLGGVPGVSAEQEARARALVLDSLRALPQYATTESAIAAGYRSIGDASTGAEHYIRYDLIDDGRFLDASAPESLVYTVIGDQRILAGAMYIASARATDDPTLTSWAGPLMQWHNHGDLCWDVVDGKPQIVGTTNDTGVCARGVNSGGENPMVHVWITPHPCGVFAALEGIGAGQASVPDDERVDMCDAVHGH